MADHKFDPSSARECRACTHAVPHDGTEFEDTHQRCTDLTTVKHGCEKHRHYRKSCEEAEDGGGCWTDQVGCDCSEEDRLIADLHHEIETLRRRVAELEAAHG